MSACKKTMDDAPNAFCFPADMETSTQVLATDMLTNPGGMTPTSAAKKVVENSCNSCKLFDFKYNISNRLSFF